jgi:transcription antitermination factor NusG
LAAEGRERLPLLKRGSEVFPQGLFDLSPADHPWSVAHTRSRQEKVLVRHLEAVGLAYFFPQYERRVRRSGRQFVSYLPLFPGYVFLRPDPVSRAAVFRSGIVVRLLEVRDQALLHGELRQLRALQESGTALLPYAPLAVGEMVTVVDGPFQGYRGRVVREQSSLRLIVSVSMLRQNVAVEFDRSSLTRVTGAAATGEEQSAVA